MTADLSAPKTNWKEHDHPPPLYRLQRWLRNRRFAQRTIRAGCYLTVELPKKLAEIYGPTYGKKFRIYANGCFVQADKNLPGPPKTLANVKTGEMFISS